MVWIGTACANRQSAGSLRKSQIEKRQEMGETTRPGREARSSAVAHPAVGFAYGMEGFQLNFPKVLNRRLGF